MTADTADFIKLGLTALALAISIGSGIYAWFQGRDRARRQEIDALHDTMLDRDERRRKDVGELRDRVTTIETELQHLPNQNQVTDMRESIQGVKGDVGAVREMLGALGSRIERIDNYLMSEGKRQ